MTAPTTDKGLRTYSAFDFRGGHDVRSSPQKLASDPRLRNRLTQARHVTYTTSGGVTKRLDVAKVNTNAIVSATTIISGGFQFRHSNGTDYNLCGTDDGKVVRLNSDGTTTNLVTGLTASTKWYFTQYADLAIIGNRADTVRSYDGTTFGVLGGSPPTGGGPFAVHGNRVLMWDNTQKSRLTFSALNDPSDYTTADNAGSIQVMRNDGGTGMWLLPMTSECLLGKSNNVYRLQGTAPATGWTITSVVPARVSAGAVSTQGAAFGANDAWWTALRGIQSLGRTQQFGDLYEKFPSEKLDPYFRPNTNYTVTLNELDESVMAYNPQDNTLYVGVDTNGNGQNDTIFVYEIYSGAWAVWPNMSCASLFPVVNGTNGTEIWMGGYDGFVYRLNVNASTNAIAASFKHITDLGMSQVAKRARHLYVYLSEEGNWSVTVTTTRDFGLSGGETYSVSALGESKTLGVNWTLGTDPLGARSQIVKRLNIVGVGEFWEFGFSNEQAGQPFTILGYQVLFRPHRIIARVT